MQRSTFKPTICQLVCWFVFSCFLLAFTGKPGGDVYEIRLNNKLILKQFVHQPLNLKTLALTNANVNDRLTVYYRHCGAIGKQRSISVKDDKGNVLKRWNYKDADGSYTGMDIAIKELLVLEKKSNNNPLSLYYAAKELPEGRMLTSLQLSDKSTVSNTKENLPLLNVGSVLMITL